MFKIIEVKKPTQLEIELKLCGGYSDYNSALMFKIANQDYKIVAQHDSKEEAEKIMIQFQLDNIENQSGLHYEIFKSDDSEILIDNNKFFASSSPFRF